MRRLIDVAHAPRAEVIAEGIESRDDVDALLAMGAGCGQGFLSGQTTFTGSQH